jgi:hypothetical protein
MGRPDHRHRRRRLGNEYNYRTRIVRARWRCTLPCGANVGDQLTLSQSQPTPLTGVNIVGKIPAPSNQIGNSNTSPIRAWDATCDWVGNGAQCNGWLLKRDMKPGSNDNDPMWLEKAA